MRIDYDPPKDFPNLKALLVGNLLTHYTLLKY